MASERIQRRIDRLLDQIEEAADQLNWSEVMERAKAVLAYDATNQDALTFIAVAERALEGSVATSGTEPSPSPSTPTSTSDLPTSFANGRYQVKRFLGQGGKKIVFLAQDTTLDREVAFALINAEGLDDVSRTRIQREAQAMGRLGSHPHIVTVFDLGQESDQPYMVTELMGGGDVEGLIENAEDHRLPLDQAIKIAQETCRGLEFAHSRGIVHRDLKPGNVWLTENGVAKIGDFGLAVSLDRSRLTQEGMMVGTVSYMPPEQAMGGEVTPRSDLYSLGAMLYEMVTGRPPFLGDDSVAIIGQHINTPPVAPTWHNGQCPRALDALILRLLAKNPSERPESATDVLSALDAIDLDTSVEQPPAAGVDEAHALDSLAGGVFVGRHQEMGELKGCLEDALSGRGRMVTLVGEPGIGKTRIAQELATYAGLRGAQVLWGRCYEEQGAPPYWPWVQAIRSYVREKEPEELRSEMGAGAEDIAEIVSDVRDRLPGLRTPPQLEPEQARFRLFDSITAFLKSAGRKQPLVLVLDDLHWADHPSLLLLEFVARELSGSRLLLVGTYRDMELSRRHPLSLTLGELTRERLFQRVLLRGLSQEDVGRFIELVSGVAPPRGMVEAVHRQTEGNPLFVTEVVRLLVQEGELTHEKAGQRDSWSVRIPEGVREVIGRRLDRLSERCNETLTIASVIGREFTLEHLRPLIEDVTEDRLVEVLEEALASRVIEELPQSVGRYQFTHALIQETLAEELSLTRRVRLHARIAESLESTYGEDAPAHAAELAHHFGRAEAVTGTEKLVQYSLLAGQHALESYAHEEALAYFERALTATGSSAADTGPVIDPDTAALLFGQGRAQLAILERYQWPQAFTNLYRSFVYYAEAGDVSAAVAIAEYHTSPWPGEHSKLGEIIAQALALVPPNSQEAGRLLCRYCIVVGTEEDRYEEAHEAFVRALAIAQNEGDTALEMRALADAVPVDYFHFRFQDALDKGLRAIELARHIDDPLAEVHVRFVLSSILHSLGELEGAEQQGMDMLAVAERIRDRSWLATSYRKVAQVSTLRGDWGAARDLSDRGLTLTPQNLPNLASRIFMEYEVGEFSQGEHYLDQMLAVMDQSMPGPTFNFAYPAMVLPFVARISGVADKFDIAKTAAQTVFSGPSVTPFVALYARTGLAWLAVQVADIEAAQEQYAAIKDHRGTFLPVTIASADRLLGLLSQTMGNLDQAANHFEDALAFCRKSGYRPELAWTCCDYADALRERNGEGDHAKAKSLLDESLAISSELGMRPLMERVLSRREILSA